MDMGHGTRDTEMDMDRTWGGDTDRPFKDLDFRYRISVKSLIWYPHNVGLCPLEFDIAGSDIRLNPISFITEFYIIQKILNIKYSQRVTASSPKYRPLVVLLICCWDYLYYLVVTMSEYYLSRGDGPGPNSWRPGCCCCCCSCCCRLGEGWDPNHKCENFWQTGEVSVVIKENKLKWLKQEKMKEKENGGGGGITQVSSLQSRKYN